MSHVDDGTLHALVDDQFDAGERAAVEAHLAACGECARRFAEATAMARQVTSLLGALDEAPIPVRTVNVVSPATPIRAPAVLLRRVAIAASVLLVAGVSYEVGKRDDPAPGPAPVSVAANERLESLAASNESSAVSAPPAAVADSRTGKTREGFTTVPKAAPSGAVAAPIAASDAAAGMADAVRPERARRVAEPPPQPSEVAVTGAGTQRSAANVSAAAPASPTPALPGYTMTESDSVPAVTVRRYVPDAGPSVTLLIVQAPGTATARSARRDGGSQFTVTTVGGQSIVRWHAQDRDYELRSTLAADSLVRLATLLR